MPNPARIRSARSTSSRYHELPPSMIVSSGAINGASRSIVDPTKAAGTMIHTCRGRSIAAITSSSVRAPLAPAASSSAIGSSATSCTTQSWPPSISRLTMLAPIRPSPIIAICMVEACHVRATVVVS